MKVERLGPIESADILFCAEVWLPYLDVEWALRGTIGKPNKIRALRAMFAGLAIRDALELIDYMAASPEERQVICEDQQ